MSKVIHSRIMFAKYEPSLADSEQLLSGWIDCQYIDKIQFSGKASVRTGML